MNISESSSHILNDAYVIVKTFYNTMNGDATVTTSILKYTKEW